jgi:hypothetical protein
MTKEEEEQTQGYPVELAKQDDVTSRWKVSGLPSLFLPFCNGQFEPVSNDPVIAFHANSSVKERAAIVRLRPPDSCFASNTDNKIRNGR